MSSLGEGGRERGAGGLSPIVGGEERVLGDDVAEEVVLGEDAAAAEKEEEVLVELLPRFSLGEKTWFRV
jgi:hypothetical protein